MKRRNVLTLGVSVTTLPTRSWPRQFAVGGGAEDAPGTRIAGDPAGDATDAGGVPAAGVAGAAGGTPAPSGAAGEDGPGAPASGGAVPGGGAAGSGAIRPKRAAVRRILKKYIATIASANAMSSPIVKR